MRNERQCLLFFPSSWYNDSAMQKELELFLQLHNLFASHSFHLYLVGGTVRDYLLNIPLDDMDVVTDATPSDMKVFLPEANYVFERFGSVSLKLDGVKFDITTLREEETYEDSRHPLQIKFVKDLSIDVQRRDFTVNALYMDDNFKVIDLVGGINDLGNKIIRMIGNPDKRLLEDPLRIIRALRFSLDYGFEIEAELKQSIYRNISLLEKLNIEKIKQDIKKIKCLDKEKISKKFADYNIKHLLDVLK